VIDEVVVKPLRRPAGAEIKTGIEAALKRSAEVEARRIHVEIRGDTVALTGTVSSWPERNSGACPYGQNIQTDCKHAGYDGHSA